MKSVFFYLIYLSLGKNVSLFVIVTTDSSSFLFQEFRRRISKDYVQLHKKTLKWGKNYLLIEINPQNVRMP